MINILRVPSTPRRWARAAEVRRAPLHPNGDADRRQRHDRRLPPQVKRPLAIKRRGGEFALIDSLRLVVPRETIHARRNPRDFHRLARGSRSIGRVPKTIHLLDYCYDPLYRRAILGQVNRREGDVTSWPAECSTATRTRARCPSHTAKVKRSSSAHSSSPLAYEHISSHWPLPECRALARCGPRLITDADRVAVAVTLLLLPPKTDDRAPEAVLLVPPEMSAWTPLPCSPHRRGSPPRRSASTCDGNRSETGAAERREL